MAKIKLTPTPELESRGIVAEQKSLDSRSIVAKVDTKALLKMLGEPEPKVEVPTKKPDKKQSRSEYHKAWAKDKAQISFRIATDLKEQIDQHTQSRKEQLAQFVVRAIKEQIKRDNAE